MEIKCLNCRQPIGVDDQDVGMSFCCENCRAENFINYFGKPRKAVYFKVRKENGEIITYGKCKNKECDGHYVGNSVFKAEAKIVCPECDTPGRPVVTTIPSKS